MPIRPSPLLRRALAPATALILLAAFTLPVQATGGSDFVALANVKRASVGVAPVALSSAVDRISTERAAQMAKADRLAHDLAYVQARLTQLGVCWKSVGEIIAWERGYPSHSYQRTIDAWWASPDHHAIMAGPYTVAGGSWTVSASAATYSVMVFVTTCSAASTLASSAPTVVARSPSAGATGISLRPSVRVTFSEQVRGVTATTFVLRAVASGTLVAATVTYDASTRRATLVPQRWLALGGRYDVILRSGIRDASGNALAASSWRFRVRTVEVFAVARQVVFSGGTHVGYRFDSAGHVVARRSYSLARASGAPSSKRAVIPGQSGIWLYVTKGVWAGYWVKASSTVRLL